MHYLLPPFLSFPFFVFAPRSTGGMSTLVLPLGKCNYSQHSLKRGMFHLAKNKQTNKQKQQAGELEMLGASAPPPPLTPFPCLHHP